MKLPDEIANQEFAGESGIRDGDLVSDVVVVVRISSSDRKTTASVWCTDHTDGIVQRGLLEVALDIIDSGWEEADADD